jgi:hypothetical protein
VQKNISERERLDMQPDRFLEDAQAHFHAGQCNAALRLLALGLENARSERPRAEWKTYVTQTREHAALKTTQLCPFIKHAVSKPFGYPGDAALIDHIYGYAKPVLTGLSRSIYACMTSASAPRSVRFRRHLLAHYIDKVLYERDAKARIFS